MTYSFHLLFPTQIIGADAWTEFIKVTLVGSSVGNFVPLKIRCKHHANLYTLPQGVLNLNFSDLTTDYHCNSSLLLTLTRYSGCTHINISVRHGLCQQHLHLYLSLWDSRNTRFSQWSLSFSPRFSLAADGVTSCCLSKSVAEYTHRLQPQVQWKLQCSLSPVIFLVNVVLCKLLK